MISVQDETTHQGKKNSGFEFRDEQTSSNQIFFSISLWEWVREKWLFGFRLESFCYIWKFFFCFPLVRCSVDIYFTSGEKYLWSYLLNGFGFDFSQSRSVGRREKRCCGLGRMLLYSQKGQNEDGDLFFFLRFVNSKLSSVWIGGQRRKISTGRWRLGNVSTFRLKEMTVYIVTIK